MSDCGVIYTCVYKEALTESVLEKSKMETPKRKRRSNERMTPGSAKRHRGTSSARNSNLLLDIHVKVVLFFDALFNTP